MTEPTPEMGAIQTAIAAADERAKFARKEEGDWRFRAEQAEGAAERLREALDISCGKKRATASAKAPAGPANAATPKRSRTEWMPHVKAVLELVGTVDPATNAERVRPTKKQLMQVLQARVPEASWATVQAFVYQAVSADKIIVRMDQCWLPGTEPARTVS